MHLQTHQSLQMKNSKQNILSYFNFSFHSYQCFLQGFDMTLLILSLISLTDNVNVKSLIFLTDNIKCNDVDKISSREELEEELVWCGASTIQSNTHYQQQNKYQIINQFHHFLIDNFILLCNFASSFVDY